MAKVSIIVPIYNVETYLADCLESLTAQTLKDIEILCVNDGSTDGSSKILEKYQQRDNRIRVISKSNTGYGDTINTGIANAVGEYIGIVESDDFAEPDMFQVLYDLALTHNADVAKGNYYDFSSETGKREKHDYLKGIPKETIVNNPMELCVLGATIWAGIYRKAYLTHYGIKLLDTRGASYQDTGFSFKVMICSPQAVFTERALLNYRNDNPNSSTYNLNKTFCIANEFEEMRKFMIAHSKEEFFPLYVTVKYYSYCWNLDRIPMPEKAKFLLRMRYEFKKHSINELLLRQYFGETDWIKINSIIFGLNEYFCYSLRDDGYEVKAGMTCIRWTLQNTNNIYFVYLNENQKEIGEKLGIETLSSIRLFELYQHFDDNKIGKQQDSMNFYNSLYLISETDAQNKEFLNRFRDNKLNSFVIIDNDFLRELDLK